MADGIWYTGGENWDSTLETICADYSEAICQWAEEEVMPWTTEGLKLAEHGAQIGYSNRFQEYVENWSEDN